MRILETLKSIKFSRTQIISGSIMFSAGLVAYGAIPNMFTAGTNISAAQMNANFTDVETRLAALESKLANVTLEQVNGQPTVRFSGVNLQVVNGQGSTATANGAGNLIVGYDEPDATGISRCTVGASSSSNPPVPVTDQMSCAAAGGTWTAAGFKTGSHYVIVGDQHNYSSWGGVIVGYRNTSNLEYASINGGASNVASNRWATVTGGFRNTASGIGSAVGGGSNNNANGEFSSISAGYGGVASGFASSVSGGDGNVAATDTSSILGGFGQSTTATDQTIPALP